MERAKTQADLVAKSYLDYKLTMDKLKEMPTEAEIPEYIKSDVLINLVPEYEKQKEKEAIKDRVTILSIALLILNSVFDKTFGNEFLLGEIYYPLQWFGNAVLGVLLIFSFLQLARPQINEFDANLQKSLREGVGTSRFITYVVSFLVGMILVTFGILLYMMQNAYTTQLDNQLAIGFAIMGAVLFIGGGYLAYVSLEKY